MKALIALFIAASMFAFAPTPAQADRDHDRRGKHSKHHKHHRHHDHDRYRSHRHGHYHGSYHDHYRYSRPYHDPYHYSPRRVIQIWVPGVGYVRSYR